MSDSQSILKIKTDSSRKLGRRKSDSFFLIKMPLTSKGKKILKAFKEEYGKEVGEKFFYAWEKKHKDKRVRFK